MTPLRVPRSAFNCAVILVASGQLGCAADLNAERKLPVRQTLGEEVYGVFCDRVGAQSLTEDLSGESFRTICHRDNKGAFADHVNTSALPEFERTRTRLPVEQQRAIARIEALGRHRASVIAALDVIIPDVEIATHVQSESRRKERGAGRPGSMRLHDELNGVLQRLASLYADGTLPSVTEALGRTATSVATSESAQTALARLDAREGYRPQEGALGAVRAAASYPGMRDLADSMLRIFSADPSSGCGTSRAASLASISNAAPDSPNVKLRELVRVLYNEIRTAKVEGTPAPFSSVFDVATRRTMTSRPRSISELLSDLLLFEAPDLGGAAPNFIVRRDLRGLAALRQSDDGVPSPLLDLDHDGLPDINALGQFLTPAGSIVPPPFPILGEKAVSRDRFRRAIRDESHSLIYDYVDTSKTALASLAEDVRVLMNPKPGHETLMNLLAGVEPLLGPRDSKASLSKRKYVASPPPSSPVGFDTQSSGSLDLEYRGFQTKSAPLLDLAYALLSAADDRNTDDLLAIASQIVMEHTGQLARVVGALQKTKKIADNHPEATLPPNSTVRDETIDLAIQIVRVPGLLEDVIKAFADDHTRALGPIFADYMNFRDELSYDRRPGKLNDPPFNLTSNDSSAMHTPVDRSANDTGANRSAVQRFLQITHDTRGVTVCNREGAIVHVLGVPVIGAIDFPNSLTHPDKASFKECEVFKIQDMGKFYLDSIVGTAQLYIRDGILRGDEGLGTAFPATVDIMQKSSGINGFWTPPTSRDLRPTPHFLNRLAFFDQQNDSPNEAPAADNPNYVTNRYLRDLDGPHIGTSLCPERIIVDPSPSAIDASPDGRVRGLRACADGDWLEQRDHNAIFLWENFGFYDAIRPILTAFVKHNREDLFLDALDVTHRHWGRNVSDSECRLSGGGSSRCTRDGFVSFEPMLTELLSTDLLLAMHELAKKVREMKIAHCSSIDPTTRRCSLASRSAIDVLSDAARSAIDPEHSREKSLVNRRGVATSQRKDGTTNAQTTPLYLILDAFRSIDDALASNSSPNQKAQWSEAQTQLLDHFFAVNGTAGASRFSNPVTPSLLRRAISLLREELWVRCAGALASPDASCAWLKNGATESIETMMAGPLFAASFDVAKAVQSDDAARVEVEKFVQYLLDPTSSDERLRSILASASDILSMVRDDANVVPLLKALAPALADSQVGEGAVVANLPDATIALLARVMAKRTPSAAGECSVEIDPNDVMLELVKKLVTPAPLGRDAIETPLEALGSAIAAVNRQNPSDTSKLTSSDFRNISENIGEFLLSQESGLEQLYAIVKHGIETR